MGRYFLHFDGPIIKINTKKDDLILFGSEEERASSESVPRKEPSKSRQVITQTSDNGLVDLDMDNRLSCKYYGHVDYTFISADQNWVGDIDAIL